ncbi:SPOR domain-containing protein [Hyphomicrobiales bacterium FT118]|uniref:SPOR domain-containing protein n=2 Tax=Futiania mangrovi TaxID=2959716 RepID=A0A9J6PC08_9PROT|nr:SPOR domain-containing protein [Futiania mangrovii]
MRPVEDGPATAAASAAAPTPRASPPRAQAAAALVPRPAPAASAGSGNFHVQVGTFSQRDNADRLVARLGRDWPGSIDPVQSSDGRTLYRVRLGPFRDAGEAAQARDAAARHGLNDARIVTDPI